MNNLKLSYMMATPDVEEESLTACRGDIDHLFATLKELGYEGVELTIRDPNKINQKNILELAQKYDLHVPAIATGQAFVEEGLCFTSPDAAIRDRALERIRAFVDFAAAFPADILVGRFRGGLPVESAARNAALGYALEGFQRSIEMASSSGLKILIEPVNRYEINFINNTMDALAWISQLGTKGFGLVLDVFHMNIEEPSLEGSIHASAPYISHIHFADSNRKAPGWGHLDFKDLIQSLTYAGYQGYISIEALQIPSQEVVMRQAAHFLGPILGANN